MTIEKKTDDNLIPCPWPGECIHRTGCGGCLALCDTEFKGGECHFRKRSVVDAFEWDKTIDGKIKKRGKLRFRGRGKTVRLSGCMPESEWALFEHFNGAILGRKLPGE